jgi:hypothetical protein
MPRKESTLRTLSMEPTIVQIAIAERTKHERPKWPLPSPEGVSTTANSTAALRHMFGVAWEPKKEIPADSMRKAMDETERRRALQQAYNQEHSIPPESIVRPVEMSLEAIVEAEHADLTQQAGGIPEFSSEEQLELILPN